MVPFGWKRKVGGNFSRETLSRFEEEAAAEEEAPAGTQWKRRKEDVQKTCEQLRAEGVRLAALNRFEEAVEEWNRALRLAADEKTLEMKAQALLQVDRPLEALRCAEGAVHMNPRWWVAHQTLGRTQLGIGELHKAKRSFSKAIHLNPTEAELWEEDLHWTLDLLKQKEEGEAASQKQPYTI